MALLDRFKKKKEEVAASEPKEVKKEKKTVQRKTEKKPEGFAWKTLTSPHVTEKASLLEGENKYVFKVSARANKMEIKKAIRGLYKVDVEKVSIINIHSKKRRVGKKGEGLRQGYKKAIVKLIKGQKIEILPR